LLSFLARVEKPLCSWVDLESTALIKKGYGVSTGGTKRWKSMLSSLVERRRQALHQKRKKHLSEKFL
jgi:hypothetical protein